MDVAADPKNRRRTVYGLVDRQSLPAVFRAFDFASPDQSVERRPRTTVPQQALFSMNAPFVVEQAKALAARPDVAAAPTTTERVIDGCAALTPEQLKTPVPSTHGSIIDALRHLVESDSCGTPDSVRDRSLRRIQRT